MTLLLGVAYDRDDLICTRATQLPGKWGTPLGKRNISGILSVKAM